MFQGVIGQSITLPFLSTNLVTGLTTFTYVVMFEGTVVTPAPALTFAEVGQGAYFFTFTPTQTGVYTVYIQGQLVNVLVGTQSLTQSLQTLTDAALGSWSWNKVSGTLTLLTSQGGTLATYTVADSPSSATRTRTS